MKKSNEQQPRSSTQSGGKVFFATGEKGGVGKTVITISLAESLRFSGLEPEIIDADIGNRDVQSYFNLQVSINLQKYSGYVDFLDYISTINPGTDIVVSLPAGIMVGANERGNSFFEGLDQLPNLLKRELIVLYAIDDKALSVAQLESFLSRLQNTRIDVVKNQFFFKSFDFFEESMAKNIIAGRGKEIVLPRLKPQIMNVLLAEYQSFNKAIDLLPFGSKIEFQVWFRQVRESYIAAGYFKGK